MLLTFCATLTFAQKQDTSTIKSLPVSNSLDTLDDILNRNLPAEPVPDTIPQKPEESKARIEYKTSDKGLDAPITYGAVDSQHYDKKSNAMHLYGEAFVDYEDKKLNADYIYFDMTNNIAYAETREGFKASKKPTFTDGQKTYQYSRLKYNFDNKKGVVYDAVTRESEFFVLGEKTKYLNVSTDKGDREDIIYNKNALITTCNHPDPHFGFRANKLKLIPDKIAIVGPANLELGGIPTPIWLPFGFFPLVQNKSSGFIFPQDYEYSPSLGFGLKGMGWYFPISDYIDLRATANVYTRGTFAVNLLSNYRKRYKYSGNINLSFEDRRFESTETLEKLSNISYGINITHNQDAKAHPFVTIGGSINIQSNNHASRINNDASRVLQNTFRSNFTYRHSMPNTPFSLTVGLNHSQNTQTRRVNITFPDVQLRMNSINPFKRKNRGGNKEAWYERIVLNYNAKMKSFIETSDTTLFTPQALDNLKTGMTQTASVSASFRFLKYFNFVPNANYDETWVLNTINREYFTENDSLATNVLTGFDSYRTYRAGASMNTQIFGTKTFSKGWFRGIRHTMKPSVGMSFAPNLFDQYQDSIIVDGKVITTYNRFQGGPFGSPSFTRLQALLTYSVNNILEIKHFARKDSSEKKFKVFDNLTINGNYNFAADTLQWSTVGMASSSRFFNGITIITTNFTFDPYIEDQNRRINTTVWSQEKKPLRLDRFTLNITNRFSFKKIRDMVKGVFKDDDPEPGRDDEYEDEEESTGRRGSQQRSGRNQLVKKEKSILDILDRINFEHNFRYNYSTINGRDTSQVVHTAGFSGAIPLTDNWNIRVGNISYDFVNKGLGYPSLTFSRDLHCWEMNFSWHPNRDTYSFFIGVKSSSLNFIKYNYGQNNQDGFFGRNF